MSELNGVGAITMFVEDPKRSRSFYEDVFEVSPIYEDGEDPRVTTSGAP